MITGTLWFNPPASLRDATIVAQLRDPAAEGDQKVLRQFAWTGVYLEPGEVYHVALDDDAVTWDRPLEFFVHVDTTLNQQITPGDYTAAVAVGKKPEADLILPAERVA